MIRSARVISTGAMKPSHIIVVVSALAGCIPQGEYLFGVDEAEIEALAAAYEGDPEVLREQLAAPFDCEAFGQLCDDVGPQEAERIVEEVVEMARDGLPLEEIGAVAMEQIDAAPPLDTSFRSFYEYTYYSSGGTDYRFVLSAWHYSVLFTKYHKARVNHHTKAVDGTWHSSPTNLYLHLSGNRRKNGNTTTKTCSRATYDDSTSCYRTFSTGGTHWGTGTATINGHTGTNPYS